MLRESNRAGGSAEHVKKDLGILMKEMTKSHTTLNTMYTLRENMDGGVLTNNDIRVALLAGATAAGKMKDVIIQSKAITKGQKDNKKRSCRTTQTAH